MGSTMAERSGHIRPQRLRTLLRRMVDIYSPSGKEGEIVTFLQGYLRRRGLPVTLQPVEEGRANLLVLPEECDAELALVGHIDTVAAPDLDSYEYAEHGDEIEGLGTADMKGGCAAMIEACLVFRERHGDSYPVALCLVVGEEEVGDGAAALMRTHHFPWAIIGEPTDLRPCLSHFGYLEVALVTEGTRRHASLAPRGGNAVETMLALILRITHHLGERRPGLVHNIRDLFSAQAGFAVPERCEARLDVHLPPGSPVGEILTELEELVAADAGEEAEVQCSMRVMTIDAGYALPEKGRLVDALRRAYASRELPWAPRDFPSHSDANHLWAAGVKSIILGPGQLEKSHSPGESVSFAQVLAAAELYLAALEERFVHAEP